MSTLNHSLPAAILMPDQPEIIQIGHVLPDGTVYAGISLDKNKPLFVRPQDETLTMKWCDAMEYAANFEGHGKQKGSFRLPTPREMRMILDNHEKIPGLRITDQFQGVANYYWTSKKPRPKEYNDHNLCSAWAEHFMGDGYSDYWPEYDRCSVRLVCD
jgi:hypothetical protein